MDTNVVMTAEGAHPDAPPRCVAESARALREIMRTGVVCVDSGRRILQEYQRQFDQKRQPGAGAKFVRWVLDGKWVEDRVHRVDITPLGDDEFAELPSPEDGTVYDPSDRKFLAVAAAHPGKPPVLQALDSKWWGWQSSLAKLGIQIEFLCPAEIERKYKEKHGK
ncbi:MAG: hypothetical protein RMK74_07485 [Myxococcales bacterium]|nr:hypothetical protein [Myxococcales bacterium]